MRVTDRSRFGVLAVLAVVVLLAPAAWASTDPGLSQQWGMNIIGAPQAWTKGTGNGIVIATVDSGIDLNHEDLKGQILKGKDYVDGDRTPQDGNGHGTHVAGIAAAVTGNGKGVAGVAPGAKILPVRIFDNNGDAHEDFATPIRWATDQGAHVINLSAGTGTQGLGQDDLLFGPGFRESLEYAWSKGVIVVVAAGNDFLLSSGYADHPAIVVSATNRRDGKPDFSSGVGNAKWGMAAPGGSSTTDRTEDDIYSTYTGNGYRYMRGTSMAAPHVAGAAAVLRGLGLGPQETVDRLLSTAKDIGPKGNDSTFGHGRLDLAAAVAGSGAGSEASVAGSVPTPKEGPRSTARGGSATPAVPDPDPGTGASPREPDAERPRDSEARAVGSPAPNGDATDDDRLATEEKDEDGTGAPYLVVGALVVATVVGAWTVAQVRRRRSSRPAP